MKRLIFFIISAVMAINLWSISFAENNSQIINPVGGYRPIIDMGTVEVDEVTEYLEPEIMPFSLPPDWIENGSRNFYNYLGTLENGRNLQGFYDRLYNPMKSYIYNPFGKTTYITATNSETGATVSGNYLCIDITDFYNVIEWEDMTHIYNSVLQDNPQIFYVDLRMVSISSSGSTYFGIQVADEYLDADDRLEEADAITVGIAEFDSIINKNMSNYSIEKKVHDKLILNNNYAFKEDGTTPLDTRYAHSIAGSLNSEYGGGVCESYAKALQLLLNRYDVPCFFIIGYANGGGHAWNFVQLDDGNYYCVDTTWDDPVVSDGSHWLRYTYFNMPYADFYSNRNNNLTYYNDALPDCSDNTDYYTSNATQYVGLAENGDYIYSAPSVSENETRITTTTVETTTETTTSKIYEYSTETTTSKFQKIAAESVKKDFVVSADSNCYFSKFSNIDIYIAYTATSSAEVSIILDEACYLQFNVQLTGDTGDKISLYIDDELKAEYTSTGLYGINTPVGQHKISWILSSVSGNYTILYNINAVAKGDYNLDGKIDLTDAIGLMNDKNLDLDLYKYVDSDNDNSITQKDIAYILKRCSGII